MPICIFCTHSISYLYTVYESEYNLRLEQCPQCHEFVDPYVEHNALTILLDLILLKRGVFRHLLYNRGTKPRRLVQISESKQGTKQSRVVSTRDRWLLIFRLGSALTFLDAFIRWSYLNPTATNVTPWTKEGISSFCRVFLGTVAETISFHGGIIVAGCLLMKVTDILKSIFYSNPSPISSIRREFRFSLISLSLFYSSLTKLFLLLLLTIWLPAPTSTIPKPENPLPEWTKHLQWAHSNGNLLTHVLEILDDDKLDREWIVRNILGGMSAGFGLRVILDIHPLFTTIMILAGWTAKTAVVILMSRWVSGNDSRTGEAWLAYSIS